MLYFRNDLIIEPIEWRWYQYKNTVCPEPVVSLTEYVVTQLVNFEVKSLLMSDVLILDYDSYQTLRVVELYQYLASVL